jgi:hypothetical protein
MISAVILTSVFLSISMMLKEYQFAESSSVAGRDENFYFQNMLEQLNKTIEYSPHCGNLTKNLNEFIYFEKKEMSQKGYIVDVYYTILDCESVIPNERIRFDLISLKSERMHIWQGKLPEIGLR